LVVDVRGIGQGIRSLAMRGGSTQAETAMRIQAGLVYMPAGR
jgi:hypothetical protein